MNIVWGALLAIALCAVTVTAMLLVRRNAPEGSYFSDGDRASGVFGCSPRASMAGKMSSRRLRTGVIMGSCVLLLVALAWVSTFPVSVDV